MTVETIHMENSKAVLGLNSMNEGVYTNLDLDRLLVCALFSMEQKKIPLFFDLLVVAAFRMFPKKFSMATFEQFPDTNRINKAARRLADPKRKAWATGNIENGFHLTALGREVARETGMFLESSVEFPKRAQGSRSRGRSSNVEIKDIYQSELYKAWVSGQQKTPHEILVFLKATPYTAKELILERLRQLRQSAADTQDKEIGVFFDWIEESLNVRNV